MAMIALCRERRSAGTERPKGLAEAELHRVVEEQTGALLGLARHFSPSTEDARDAVQSGLEILLRHRHRIGAEWVLPWLHTVVRHEALRPRREGSRGLGLEDDLGAPRGAVAAAGGGQADGGRRNLSARDRSSALGINRRRSLAFHAAGCPRRDAAP